VIEDDAEPDKSNRFPKQGYNAIAREFETSTKNPFPHTYESARDMYHAYRYMGKYDKLITLINCKKMTFSPTSRNIATRYRTVYRAIEGTDFYLNTPRHHFFVDKEDKALCKQFMSNTIDLLMQKNVESKKKRKEFQGKVEMEKYSKREKGVLYIE